VPVVDELKLSELGLLELARIDVVLSILQGGTEAADGLAQALQGAARRRPALTNKVRHVCRRIDRFLLGARKLDHQALIINALEPPMPLTAPEIPPRKLEAAESIPALRCCSADIS